MYSQRAGDDDQQKKLYQLIRQRTIACQMSPAQILKTEIRLFPDGFVTDLFIAKGEEVLFPGFLQVYGVEADETVTDATQENQHLPALQNNDKLTYTTITAMETVSKPLPRFTEAMLVKTMEENGI
jgi:DNA topoisomerase-1